LYALRLKVADASSVFVPGALPSEALKAYSRVFDHFGFLDVASGFLEFAISFVSPLSARYFLSPAKGGSLPVHGGL
jgi:hypothetical protein